MLGKISRVFFGSKNDRELKRMGKLVTAVNALEDSFIALNDKQLTAKTAEYRERYEKGETLNDLLPEAFAAAREASKRVMSMRHFDVQLIGGITLHEGCIAEMRTGEGKTLMATLAAYLNAISGKGVHIVTVNDYLAQRDANWMAPLYKALGLTTGSVYSMQQQEEKRAAYQADITYGTNNEFGFDYLRDNMALTKEERVQRPLNFAIVDEVDSILIDEARTPLIISGAAEDSSDLYRAVNKVIPGLKSQAPLPEGMKVQNMPEIPEEERGHYILDEKNRQVDLTEMGHETIEATLIKEGLLTEGDSLYSPANLSLLHHVHAALKAHTLFQRNVEYIVQDGEVVLIDEHTGRTMAGRRLSEGLHQAIEAKEGVNIQAESQTLASTTFQNYFRIYPTLSGMTGTADTEAFEFKHIYGLNVVVIPTNKNVQRKDLNDLVFLSVEEKYDAIIRDINEFRAKGAPVLVGTATVETSESMSQKLQDAGIEHEVLNAKQHEREADIIAQAGRPGRVTIATNMAGRGTDIVLGGNWEAELASMGSLSDTQIAAAKKECEERHKKVLEAGGLHIIGTERHESRRIDNQLRGRAGRQGDPGLSRFYLSLEDNLMRIFASDKMRGFMQSIGLDKGEAIEHRMVSNAIEKAQRKVEGRNFDYRKQILEYDDVANDQRGVIYTQRNELLEAEEISDAVDGIRADVVSNTLATFIPPQSVEEQWDVDGLEQNIQSEYGLTFPIQKWLDEDDNLNEESLREKLTQELDKAYNDKREQLGEGAKMLEKQIMLHVLDQLWKEHLQSMDYLRQGIGLRAYAQKNPKQEYKRESFEMFQGLLESLKQDVTRLLFRVQPMSEDEIDEMEQRKQQEAQRRMQQMQMQHDEAPSILGDSAGEPAPETASAAEPVRRNGQKVGRNDPCPCGSGKKFKACCGKLS